MLLPTSFPTSNWSTFFRSIPTWDHYRCPCPEWSWISSNSSHSSSLSYLLSHVVSESLWNIFFYVLPHLNVGKNICLKIQLFVYLISYLFTQSADCLQTAIYLTRLKMLSVYDRANLRSKLSQESMHQFCISLLEYCAMFCNDVIIV